MTPSFDQPPACAVRVGITGHRTDKLTKEQIAALDAPVTQILTAVANCAHRLLKDTTGYAQTPPILRVVSSLAEGSDRVVAQAGLDLGFKLQAPLPANRTEYRQDFKGESAAEFDKLCANADSVFELDGRRAGAYLESDAYTAAGRIMLAHTDVLIAIWDGEPGKPGGSEQILKEARHAEIPVLWIRPQTPDSIVFLPPEGDPIAAWQSELERALFQELAPPKEISEPMNEFLGEAAKPPKCEDPVCQQMQRADDVAMHYAKRYRSAYRLLFFLAPLAVLFAVLGWWLESNKIRWVREWCFTALTASELACIAVIFIVASVGHRQRWHNRWMDARVLAEQFRVWELLAPIGHTPPTSRVPPYISANPKKGDWTGWYFRARVREHGLPSAVLTPQSLNNYQERLIAAIGEQADHHKEKGGSRRRVHKGVEALTRSLFGITFGICVWHLGMDLAPSKDAKLVTALAAITAVLPAVASAMEGLQAQGEYQRLSERSEGMHEYLTSLQSQIPADRVLPHSALSRLAHQTASVMLDELLDWRNLVRVRILVTT